jgi:hypothetical protein
MNCYKEDIVNDLNEFYTQRDCKNKEKYLWFLIIITLIYIFVIIVGTIIFMYIFNLTWVDALYSSVLILTGIDIEVTPVTDGQKIFIVIYELFTIIILLSFVNVAVEYFLI